MSLLSAGRRPSLDRPQSERCGAEHAQKSGEAGTGVGDSVDPQRTLSSRDSAGLVKEPQGSIMDLHAVLYRGRPVSQTSENDPDIGVL